MLVSVLSAVSIKVVGNQHQLPQIVHTEQPSRCSERKAVHTQLQRLTQRPSSPQL